MVTHQLVKYGGLNRVCEKIDPNGMQMNPDDRDRFMVGDHIRWRACYRQYSLFTDPSQRRTNRNPNSGIEVSVAHFHVCAKPTVS